LIAQRRQERKESRNPPSSPGLDTLWQRGKEGDLKNLCVLFR
jgi:hypothetical protein